MSHVEPTRPYRSTASFHRCTGASCTELGSAGHSESADSLDHSWLETRLRDFSKVVASGLFLGTLGILGSSLMAGALNHAGSHNGSVTALAGTFRFASGAMSGVAVSLLHNDTFVPMVGIMATTGLLSFACYWGIARRVPMPITTG